LTFGIEIAMLYSSSTRQEKKQREERRTEGEKKCPATWPGTEKKLILLILPDFLVEFQKKERKNEN
jgi:hypothetical protein